MMTPGGTRWCRRAFSFWYEQRVSPAGMAGGSAGEIGTVSTASLLIVEGVGRGTRFQIGRQRVGIGRSSENAIRIADEEASRFHAAIQWQASSFELLDLGSANGTLLNGTPIKRSTVSDGDQLQVANTLLQFRIEGRVLSGSRLPVDLVPGPDERTSIVSETADVATVAPRAATESSQQGSSPRPGIDLAGWQLSESEALARRTFLEPRLGGMSRLTVGSPYRAEGALSE